jgi:formylglycine-generating enzyme required for sulfatase activity
MKSRGWLDAFIPARGLKVVGGGLLVVGLVLPWMRLELGSRNDGVSAGAGSGDVRPAMRVLPAAMRAKGGPSAEEGRLLPGTVTDLVQDAPFAISTTEVTQAQYERVMGTNPSEFRGQADRPVETVSWFDAIEYCNRLSELEGLERCYEVAGRDVQWPKGPACLGYRLPTEAEWEYAARADSSFVYAGGNEPDRVAWYDANSGDTTHPVGARAPNGWGLYDMSGNVWEWVWEVRDPRTTGGEVLSSPGSDRVIRGGSFINPAEILRVARRFRYGPSSRDGYLGFRLSRSFPSAL